MIFPYLKNKNLFQYNYNLHVKTVAEVEIFLKQRHLNIISDCTSRLTFLKMFNFIRLYPTWKSRQLQVKFYVSFVKGHLKETSMYFQIDCPYVCTYLRPIHFIKESRIVKARNNEKQAKMRNDKAIGPHEQILQQPREPGKNSINPATNAIANLSRRMDPFQRYPFSSISMENNVVAIAGKLELPSLLNQGDALKSQTHCSC